jgi:DNA-cytosine methyltransferase
MNVLSLFDGMSCGQQALDRLGVKVDNYFASEIDKYAIQVTMANYPNTIQLGSVVNINAKTICLLEVYSYICKKYFNNDIQSLQSIISEWEMLHRIDKEQTFSAYFGTQKSNEEQKAQPNTTLSINDRIWFWKREMGNNKGVYDIIRSGNRGKISNKIDVGELCKHSFWWNGDRQSEYRTSEESVIGANGIKEIRSDKAKITRNSHQAVFNDRIEGTSKDESIRTISKPTKKEKLFNSNEEIGQEINRGEEEKNRINKEGNQISENERFVQTNYEVNGISKINEFQLSIYKKVQVTIIECEWGVIILKDNIKMTFGGSPCQSFSFAGKRKGMSTKCETEILTLEHYLELKSEGYEFEGQSYLFWEYMRLLNECKPTYFLLENVEMGEKWEKVLSKAIGVNGIHINSALLSAQNRRRIYWTNIGMQPSGLFGDLESIIEQPKDRGILLKDVLETEVDEKYFLSDKAINYINRDKRNLAFQMNEDDNKSGCITAVFHKQIPYNQLIVHNTMPRSSTSGKGGTGPLSRADGKTYCLDTGNTNAVEVREIKQISTNNKSNGNTQPYQQDRIYDVDGISPALNTDGRGHAVEVLDIIEAQKIVGSRGEDILHTENDKLHTLCSQNGGKVRGRGLFVNSRIRRLTPIECERLQTVADNYTNHVSDSQRYKMLGNGWTIDVIAHILKYAF